MEEQKGDGKISMGISMLNSQMNHLAEDVQ